jgi:hypothetical protein
MPPSIANGRSLKAMWGPATHDGVSLFPTYENLGVGIYEDDLHWDSIALRRPQHSRSPNDPAYAWPAEVTKAVSPPGRRAAWPSIRRPPSPHSSGVEQDAVLGNLELETLFRVVGVDGHTDDVLGPAGRYGTSILE